MNFKSRLTMTLKSIAVWWGIFIILGCCAGFVYKMLFNIVSVLNDEDRFNLQIFLPLLFSGSLILAIVFCFIRSIALKLPTLRFKTKLRGVLSENGISNQYIHFLLDNSKGAMKTRMMLEACNAYTLLGNFEQADEILSKLDIKSITDTADSTGDVYNVSFYYCEKMLLCYFQNDIECFDCAFEDAQPYFEHMTKNYRVRIITGFYHFVHGGYQKCIAVLENTKFGKKKYYESKYAVGTVSALRGVAYMKLENYAEAEKNIRYAIDAEISDFFDTQMGNLIKECRKHLSE